MLVTSYLKQREKGLDTIHQRTGCISLPFGGKRWKSWGKILSCLEQPVVFFLNETKNAEAWGGYYPFTLSIDKPDELYAFLKGDVYLMVAIELGVCRELATEKGWELNYRETGDYAFEFHEAKVSEKEPFRFHLSRHFIGRIAHEFLSLQWVMDFQEHNNLELKSLISESVNA